SKRNSGCATLPATTLVTATAVSHPTRANLPQVPNIKSRVRWSGCGFVSSENAEPTKLSISLLQQFVDWNLGKFRQNSAQGCSDFGCNRIIVSMRATFRFRNDFVDHFQFQQILCGQFKSLGRFSGMSTVSPQNRGTRFRADYRIVSVFQDRYMVCDANAQRPA